MYRVTDIDIYYAKTAAIDILHTNNNIVLYYHRHRTLYGMLGIDM